jgi:hypothetical protein
MCKLYKAIYGLEQSWRTWFQWIYTYLWENGLIKSNANSNQYIMHNKVDIIILILYVNN